MKKLFFIISITIAFISCKAQDWEGDVLYPHVGLRFMNSNFTQTTANAFTQDTTRAVEDTSAILSKKATQDWVMTKINNSSGGGSQASRFLQYDAVNNWLTPYATKQTNICAYLEDVWPTNLSLLNLNASVRSSRLYSRYIQADSFNIASTTFRNNTGSLVISPSNQYAIHVLNTDYSYFHEKMSDKSLIITHTGGYFHFSPVDAISTLPAIAEKGTVVQPGDATSLYYYNGSTWGPIGSGTGGALSDNFLHYNSGGYLEPHSSRQNYICAYTGNVFPNLTTRLNINAYLYATHMVTQNMDVTHLNSLAGVSATPAIYGYNSTTNLASDHFNSIGLSGNSTTRTSLELKNSSAYSGTGTVYTNFITINDNPTTTAVNERGYILNAQIGGVQRLLFYPRVVNSPSSIAYLFDTHAQLTGNARIISVKNNGVELLALKEDTMIFNRAARVKGRLIFDALKRSDTAWVWVAPDGFVGSDSIILNSAALHCILPDFKTWFNDRNNGELKYPLTAGFNKVRWEYGIKGSPWKTINKLQGGLEISYRYIDEIKNELAAEKEKNITLENRLIILESIIAKQLK